MEELKRKQKILHQTPEAEAVAYASHEKEGIVCPKCGAVNEKGATFCENCGKPIGEAKCPNCGAPLAPGADYCESCHRYIQKDICSFCGTTMSSDDLFCPECGASRDGIVCPVCHTRNIFSFCVNCGTPLTESARQERAQVVLTPQYLQMKALAAEYERLQHVLAIRDEDDAARLTRADDIRKRVLTLLNGGKPVEEQQKTEGEGLSDKDLAGLLLKKRLELQHLLDGMTLEIQTNSAMSRRYALARKPAITQLGWRCNFKNEMHHGPQECACPQMGGKWIVLDGKKEKELKK